MTEQEPQPERAKDPDFWDNPEKFWDNPYFWDAVRIQLEILRKRGGMIGGEENGNQKNNS